MKVEAADSLEGEELGPRARQILRAAVQQYLDTGEPVASQVLARSPGIVLSPASVRAVLADLEALGYLDKPHTSAGRIPTDKGFRFFAAALVRLRPLGGKDKERIDLRYDPARPPASAEELLGDASRLLHELTRWTAVVSTPRGEEAFRSIDFIRLREGRVLAVCVTHGGQVRNRVLTVEFPLTDHQLEQAGRYLHELCATASTLAGLRAALARELQGERARADELTQRALVLGAKALEPVDRPQDHGILVEGGSALVEDDALAQNVEKLRAIFRSIEEKERIGRLLERVTDARDLTLFIGEETGLGAGDGLAVVATPYLRGGEVLGAIGVIGPSRMSYGRVIPIVEYTARALSRSLEEG